MPENVRTKNKLVIFAGYKCNNNCIFCINTNKREIPSPKTQKILEEIFKAGKNKIDILEIIGGEPTIRKDFLKLVGAAKKSGIKDIVISTNGRMFSDLNFAKKAIEAGLNTIIFSVHGHNAQLHDSLTRVSGSWDELVKGIKNLKKLGFRNINGNTTIVKQNIKYLIDIGKFYIENKIKYVEFIFVDPNYGGAHDNFYQQVPKISEAAPYIYQVLDYGLKKGYNKWNIRYVPLCYFINYPQQVSEINESEIFYVRHIAPDFINNNVLLSRKILARKKTDRCRGCKLFNICEGLWIEYLKHYGDSELKPIKSISTLPKKWKTILKKYG